MYFCYSFYNIFKASTIATAFFYRQNHGHNISGRPVGDSVKRTCIVMSFCFIVKKEWYFCTQTYGLLYGRRPLSLSLFNSEKYSPPYMEDQS